MLPINRMRNFGILAHIDSGKTTLSERILLYSGSIHQMVEVHEGGAHMDHDELERLKGITINAAVTTVHWNEHQLNLIDTPGHVDFTAEVERSCRVLDGAVVVFCAVAGVQAQSETVWRQADRYNVPRILFINKMDREGAEFERVVNETRDHLLAHPVVCSIPIGSGDAFTGVIDILAMQAVYFDGDKGKDLRREDIPDELLLDAKNWRHQLCESLASEDETVLEQFLANGDVETEALISALAQACHAGTVHPVFAGSALANKGVQLLMDGINAFLPDPTQVAAERVYSETDEEGTVLLCDASLPLRAMVFKLDAGKHGDIAYVRVYQGTLSPGDQVLAVRAQADGLHAHGERIQRLVRVDSDKHMAVNAISAGDVCAVIGCKNVVTGDTLIGIYDDPVSLSGIQFAEAVIEMAIEPERGTEADVLAKALARTAKEDPTFSYRTDAETGQLLIAGMGELHLEVVVHRLGERHKVKVHMGKPQVSYRSRITKAVSGRYVHKVQNGGPGSYAIAEIEFRPLNADELNEADDYVFVDRIRGGAIKKEYIPAVEKGIANELANGIEGIPVCGVHACLIDGHTHVTDSNEMSFHKVGRQAVREALPELGIEITEPWMRVHIECPADKSGTVIGGINAKRGIVQNVEARGTQTQIIAEAPLAEMFGYIRELRSNTAGRGNFTMEPIGYRVK